MLDEPSRAFWEQIRSLGAARVHESTPAAARAAMAARQAANPPGPELPSVVETHVPALGGGMRVRVYLPPQPRGSLVFCHGGGWVLGDLEGFDHYARRLAVALRLAVVSPDYRLAPEHRYPAAVEDAWAAVGWAHSELGCRLPEGPLLVGGDSAGGNLAAVAARRAVDTGIPLAAQLLVYPVTDADFERPSYRDPENQLLVDAQAMRWFWDQYAPDPADRAEPDASPIRGPLGGLPPTIVATAEHDPLRDEGEAYAGLLAAAGVPVVLRRFDGQMHGFATMPSLPASAELLGWLATAVDEIL